MGCPAFVQQLKATSEIFVEALFALVSFFALSLSTG